MRRVRSSVGLCRALGRFGSKLRCYVKGLPLPKGAGAQIAYTSAPKYLRREYTLTWALRVLKCRKYFKAKVYGIWVHGP